MKKIGSLLLCLMLIALIFPLNAQADVIYEPNDNFYQNNYESCTYVNRVYTAKGPEGAVTVYKSPVSSKVMWTIPNGNAVTISYTYTDSDGIVWGVCEDWENGQSGWVPMAYLEVVYDNVSFWEEYGETFLDQEGQLDAGYAGQTIWFWNYPGCETGTTFQLSEEPVEYFLEYDTVYQDEQGRSWAYIMYYYGMRQVWICLDDPTADFATLFPGGAPENQSTAPSETAEPIHIVPKESTSAKIFSIVAVVLLVIVTVVMLTKMKKKQR